MKHRRSHRPIVRARGTRYAQWTVLIVAAALFGRLVWQGMYSVLHSSRRQDADQSARPVAKSPQPLGEVSWQRDVLSSIEGSMLDAQSGNISAAEIAADRASSIITGARLRSQAAEPDFFSIATNSLDRVVEQHPEDERLFEHVVDTRIELAQLRTWQNATPDAAVNGSLNVPHSLPGDVASGSATLDQVSPGVPQARSAGQGTVAGASRNFPGHVTIASPREIAASETLDPKSLGGTYLDATLMPDAAEILLPPATRSVADNVRVESLTIAGAAQTLDGIHWKNVTFIGTRLRFEGGSIDLQNVHFVRCTFGFPPDLRGAQLATAIALGKFSITIE